MSRLRLTSSETTGIAVLLLCIAMPVLFHLCGPPPHGPSAADSARADSIAQARIDSAQHRSDSILDARTAARTRRDSLRRRRRDSIRAVRAFRPSVRERLDDLVDPAP